MTKNWKKNKTEIFFFFFDQKLQFPYPQASIKYVQVIEEVFSSQKRPSNTSKHELLPFFFYFCGSFLPSWIRIRIPNTDPDPDPQTRLNTDPIRTRIRCRIRIHNPVWIRNDFFRIRIRIRIRLFRKFRIRFRFRIRILIRIRIRIRILCDL